jgi:tRNA (guanosine-2'-O-)-methyltransferase
MSPERKASITYALNRRQPDITVVMENVHDPHNIAAVMRTCDSIGITEIFILNNRIGRHGLFGNKASSGSAKWLVIHEYEDTEECVKAIKDRGYHMYATHLGEHAKSLYELDLTQKVALVFGNEHGGLTDELLEHCEGNFIIPQVGMVKSLNISVACAVTLYEAYRQRELKGCYTGENQLPADMHKALTEKWGLTEE